MFPQGLDQPQNYPSYNLVNYRQPQVDNIEGPNLTYPNQFANSE